MKLRTRAPLNACRAGLLEALLKSAPQCVLDKNGYVDEAENNLIAGVHLKDFEADLRQGDGNELEGKFRAAYSSSALAVNTFAPFKARPAEFLLPQGNGFTRLDFERKCPHGLAGRRSPNLDILADGPNGVIAVESKCLEPMRRHKAKFAPAYDAEITDERRESPWFRAMQQLVEDPHAYRWLDAAQLVKHAFGIAYTFANRPVVLLYLFWEPSNPESNPFFAEHRAEVSQFSASVLGGHPSFAAMSYPELWAFWNTHSKPEWLSTHIDRLKARYGIAA